MSADLKKRAAARALDFVEPGMRLGIGTGSTADEFTKLLGEKVAAGLDVIGVPTSERTARLAASLGIRLATLDELPELDLTVDGADEIGPGLSLIKGGGGAHLREKIVASASARMVVIADASKVVATLGAFPLPIEVVPFGLRSTLLKIEKAAADLGLSGALTKRTTADGGDFVTDGGHLLLDASFRRIPDPMSLARALVEIPGVVEHGLFLGIATAAVVAHPDRIDVLTP
ncbi:MAG: ribose-5-phosphate isomerase RpiA [Phyllobacteriaceae bacterium]|nr:ribose-5-phosphate isomerase RpiA [Phyllobacteriaceae bacterium]